MPASNHLFLLIRDTVDETVQPHGVGRAVEEHAFARQAVPAGSARLLVVTLDVLGQVVVHDEPDVGLVDAHAERDGRDDDLDLVLDEEVLPLRTFHRIEAGVVRAMRRLPRPLNASASSSVRLRVMQ